jgi:serpin B
MGKKDLVRIAAVLVVALIVPLTGCTDPDFTATQDEKRWMGIGLNETGASDDGVARMSEAVNRFGIDMYKELNNGTNLFISPYSIFTALSMTYEGARGNTADQMADVLHLPGNDTVRRGSFARIQNRINGSDDYELSSPNKIWPAENYPFLQSFFDIIRDYYYGGIEYQDYWNDPEGSRQNINHWVENQTNDRIKDLIPQGIIDQNTVMVLTNAIYFLGKWLYEFNTEETKNADFMLSSGTTVKVPTMGMKVEDGLNYYEDDDLQAVELPYKGGNLSMTILLPKGSISTLESSLTEEKLSDVSGEMKKAEIDVFLPKFEMTSEYTLKDPLMDLGMVQAFGDADFSGMNGGYEPLQISEVLHKAFVKVDEEGTEAAAATAVVIRNYSGGPDTPIFRADHPFIFLIKERSTDSILFMGKLEDPDGTPVSEDGPSEGTRELDDKNATEEGIADISDSINQLGIDLYQLLAGTDNTFISPYSIFSALSMVYEGAKGNTAKQMADILHLLGNDSVRQGSFARIQKMLSNGSAEYNLSTANRIWPDINYPFLQTYYDLIADYYYGGIEELDYFKDPEGSRQRINYWVENQTNDRIKDLLPEGSIDRNTVMVLTNAIYFLGTWKYPFNETNTMDSDFFLSDGSTATVPTMEQTIDYLNYYSDDAIQAIELPYMGDNLSMTILLPMTSISDIDPSLTAEMISNINANMDYERLSYHCRNSR